MALKSPQALLVIEPAVLEDFNLVAAGADQVVPQIFNEHIEVSQNLLLERVDFVLKLVDAKAHLIEIAFGSWLILLSHIWVGEGNIITALASGQIQRRTTA